MTVYPDGPALSEWERHILDDIERDIEASDPELVALLFQGDPIPVYTVAGYLLAAETAVAMAAMTVSVTGLVTIAATLWVTSVRATQKFWAARR